MKSLLTMARELVFTPRTGRPIQPRSLVRSFRRICDHNHPRLIKVHRLGLFPWESWLARRAGLEPATRCLEGLIGLPATWHCADQSVVQVAVTSRGIPLSSARSGTHVAHIRRTCGLSEGSLLARVVPTSIIGKIDRWCPSVAVIRRSLVHAGCTKLDHQLGRSVTRNRRGQGRPLRRWSLAFYRE
jgi:hypothetical protein